jgi:uncharacterized protein YjbJ (UPF0337 family)
MNTLTLKGDWNITKGKLKQKYAKLTDDDLQFVSGKEDELIGRIQKRTGVAQEEIRKTWDELNRDPKTDGNRTGHAHVNP